MGTQEDDNIEERLKGKTFAERNRILFKDDPLFSYKFAADIADRIPASFHITYKIENIIEQFADALALYVTDQSLHALGYYRPQLEKRIVEMDKVGLRPYITEEVAIIKTIDRKLDKLRKRSHQHRKKK